MEIENKNVIEQLDDIQSGVKATTKVVEEVKAANEAGSLELKELRSELTEVKSTLARSSAGSVETKSDEPTMEQKHSNAFREFAAHDFAGVKAANVNTVTAEEGGFLVPPTLETDVIRLVKDASPARQYMAARTINGPSMTFNYQTAGVNAEWVTELGTRAQTSSPEFAQAKIEVFELYAYPELTLRAIEDTAFNIESFVAEQVAEEVAVKENQAFLTGDGVEKPQGLLTYVGAQGDARTIQEVGLAGSTGVTLAELYHMQRVLKARYRQAAAWVMNSNTFEAIFTLTNGINDPQIRSLDQEGGFVSDRLLGKPVFIDENLPDLEAGNNAILYGDMSGYQILDRLGMSIVRDNITKPGFLKYHFRLRVGGGLRDGNKIVASVNA